MESEWKVRLLNGVLNGREIWLEEGKLTLGERNGDVRIPLTTDDHICLSAREERLFIDAGRSVVRINGRKHATRQPLPLLGIAQVAGLTFAFGAADCNLAEVTLPKRKSRLLWVIGILLLPMLGTSTLLLQSKPIAVAEKPAQHFTQLLQSLHLTQVKMQWTDENSVTLSGYCQVSMQMQKVHQQLESEGIFYRDHVVCADQLTRDVADILQQAGYPDAQVVSDSPGSVVIRADITVGKRWETVQALLKDLPGLQHWQIENSHESQGNAVIDALLHNGLANSLSVRPVGQTFVISGILSADNQRLLESTMASLQRQFPSLILNYQSVPANNDEGNQLPSPIVGFISGRRGASVVLENGTHLQIGNRLPDGSQVVALNTHALTLRHNQSLTHYSLNFLNPK